MNTTADVLFEWKRIPPTGSLPPGLQSTGTVPGGRWVARTWALHVGHRPGGDSFASVHLRHPPAVAGGRGAGGCFTRAPFCPVAEGGDLAVHQLRQGDGAGDGFEDVLGLRFLAFGVCLVHGVDEHRLDLLLGIC